LLPESIYRQIEILAANKMGNSQKSRILHDDRTKRVLETVKVTK
jgi:hypothetical protein